MTTNDTTVDRSSGETSGSGGASGARAVGAELASIEWTWIAAALAGGALLLSGLRTIRERRVRALVQLAAGGALLAGGVVRRRRSRAASHRGPDEPAPESAAEDEGRVQFSTDQTDDGTEEVDISEAALADEPGEAAGPSGAEGQPTTTKAHGSRPTDTDTPDVESDVDGGDADEEETVQTEGGAAVHTDTVESGTMDLDEEDVTDESGDPIDDPGEELADDGTDKGSTDDQEETAQTEGGAEVHTDTNEAGTMDVDEEAVTGESGEAVEDAGVEKVTDGEADFSATSGEASGATDDDAESAETEQTEGGAAVHTDTNEAGTMTVDEEVIEETDLDEAAVTEADAEGEDVEDGDVEESDPDDEATGQ